MRKTYSPNITLRICHIASGDLWAGAEVQLATTLECLISCRILEISAILLNHGTLAKKLIGLGIPVYVIDEKRYSFLNILFKSFNILRNIQPNILHSHRYKENFLASLLGLVFHKTKKVRTQHTTFFTLSSSDSLKMRLYRIIDIISARTFADKLIAVSEDISRQISSIIGSNRIVTVHNFVDPMKVFEKANYREPRNWDENSSFFIGTAGRLVHVKGYRYLIEAAKLVCNDSENIKFIIVGSGPLHGELANQIRQAGITEKVILTGLRNDVESIIRSLDIFVISSLYEGIPMAMLEAMALRKPIIATKVGGIPEVITHNYNGILIEPRNERMLYEKCMYLYRNKNLRQALAENALNTVKKKFSPLNNVDQILAVYKEML